MSKKILLKKDRDDSQVEKPKILIKSSNVPNSTVVTTIKKPEEEKLALKYMKASMRIMTNFQLESTKLEKYLDNDNR